MSRFLSLLFPLLALLSQGVAAAEERVYAPSEVPNVQLRDYRRFVSDPEGFFTTEEREEIDRALLDLRERHTVEAVLVVVPAVPDDDPEAFTEELFRLWGIGRARDDNGLLLLYVTGHDRLVRFETGYGLEGALPDAATYSITQRILIPLLKEGKAKEAFLEGIRQIDTYLTDGYDPGEDEEDNDKEPIGAYILGAYILLAAGMTVFFLVRLVTTVRRETTPADKYMAVHKVFREATPGTILFFPFFIPFLFPFLLLVRAKWRRRLADCPYCGSRGTVTPLRSPDALAYLSEGEALEDKLQSVSHPVLRCSRCGRTQVLSLDRAVANYSRCPVCGVKACHLTYASDEGGTRIALRKCEHCGHIERVGRVSIDDDDDDGPFFFGGGGFGGGGGGFGGGFGGGASGGGGSTGRF